MRFNSKKEFAEAIIKYGELYDKFGNRAWFDATRNPPFRYENVEMEGTWRRYNETWSVEKSAYLKDKQPVWCWDDRHKAERRLRFYDKESGCTFDSDGSRIGFKFSNYKPLTEEELKVLGPMISEMKCYLKD